jgi:hypothetical protein
VEWEFCTFSVAACILVEGGCRFGMWASRSPWAEPGGRIANRTETQPSEYRSNIPQLNA